jgi:threonine/homoserine/homoserine lactone efflux protein
LDKSTLLQNIILGLTLAAPIGPVNLEIIKRGVNFGFRQSFFTGLGAMSADATYLTLIFFGLTAFLNIAFMKIFLGIAGSIILIYLGALSIKDYFQTIKSTGKSQQRLFNSSYITGYVLAISSPLTIVWWTGVFGALLASQTNSPTGVFTFISCLSILLGCFLWVFSLAVALHFGRKFINEKTTGFISLIAGVFLIVFGFYFMYQAVTLYTR